MIAYCPDDTTQLAIRDGGDTTPVDAAAEAARVLSERPFAPCDIWRGPGDPPESGEDDESNASDGEDATVDRVERWCAVRHESRVAAGG